MLYRDVGKIIGFGTSFLMYITPVVYPIPGDGLMKRVMELNPLTPIIITSRDLVTGMDPAFGGYFLLVMSISIPLFIMGLVFYRISIPIIIER